MTRPEGHRGFQRPLCCPLYPGTLPPALRHSCPGVSIPGAAEYRTQDQTDRQVHQKKPRWGMKEVAFHAPGGKQPINGNNMVGESSQSPCRRSCLSTPRCVVAVFKPRHVLLSLTGYLDLLRVMPVKIRPPLSSMFSTLGTDTPALPHPLPHSPGTPLTHHFPVPPHSLKSLGCWPF